ncbi:MAG TPA: division/cell wall cluster transcriptional repressor MraZ [Chloroflexia bacterium]|nr:division/cell wall cluster transcriptional repressor MraZ [Chloroflexia bacterium]
MFLGRFDHVLDEKGRLAIPARFRSGLQEGMVLTRGTDRCLYLFPESAWTGIAARLDALPMGDPNARNLRRAAFAAAEPVELDKQGRVVVSERLRSYAGLTGAVAVVGMNTYIEIWEQGAWDALETRVEEQGEILAQQMAGQF